MRVNALNTLSQPQCQPFNKQNVNLKNNNPVSFRAGLSVPGEKTRMIVNDLLKKGIVFDASQRSLPSRDFVAECVEKTVNVFEKLFGSSSLPSLITLKPLGGPIGTYRNSINEAAFDSNMSCFESMAKLKLSGLSRINPMGYTVGGMLLGIAPRGTSTTHPAHVFIHEFAHSAHWKHLVERNGKEDALKVWKGLEGNTIPNAIGRMITRYELGEYAVDSLDMCEFAAERITQDIGKSMPLSTNLSVSNSDVCQWDHLDPVDVGYSDIFARKHNYRYSSPKAYIDYFMQQVWNGDLEGAKQVGRDAEDYLASIESNKVPDSVVGVFNAAKQGASKIGTELDKVANQLPDIAAEGVRVLAKGAETVSNGIEEVGKKVSSFFNKMSENLDNANKIKVKKWWR